MTVAIFALVSGALLSVAYSFVTELPAVSEYPLNNICNSAEDCIPGAVCYENAARPDCRCPSKAVLDEEIKECVLIRNYGEHCQSDRQCANYVNSKCNGKCSCKEGHQWYESNRACCPPNHIVTGDDSVCTEIKAYGEPCTSTLQCDYPNSMCNRSFPGICLCQPGYNKDPSEDACCLPGYKAVPNGLTCIRKYPLNNQCNSAEDCIPGAVCYANAVWSDCRCPYTAVLDEKKAECVTIMPYGGKCTTDEQCTYLNGKCSGTPHSNCLCKAGHQKVNNQEACCPPGHVVVLDGEQCAEVKAYGEACTSTLQCNYPNSMCNRTLLPYTCSCQKGYSKDPSNDACCLPGYKAGPSGRTCIQSN